MKHKITIQDIADELGLSRNTVSNALKHSPLIPEKTRVLVAQKANEMDYYKQKRSRNISLSTGLSIVILTRASIKLHFWTYVTSGIEKVAAENGHSFQINVVNNDDIKNLRIPDFIKKGYAVGVICIELFDTKYIDELCKIGVPIVSIDTAYEDYFKPNNRDIISMENSKSVHNMVETFYENGYRSFGFYGYKEFARGFYERYLGFMQALSYHNLEVNPAHLITEKEFTYIDHDGVEIEYYKDEKFIIDRLKRCGKLPQVFFACNDTLAIPLIGALKKMGYRVPEDVSVTGFDDIPEAELMSPSLTTVHTFKKQLGIRAAQVLLWRKNNSDKPYENIYAATKTIYRNSSKIKTINRSLNYEP